MCDIVIPETRRNAVEAALRTVFGAAPVTLSPVHAGFSGALVARADGAGRTALLRVETARDALRDPARQYACMTAAAEAGVAPAVLHADAQAGVAITAFIEARPIGDYPGGVPAMAGELAALTFRLRATPPFPPLAEHLSAVDGLLRGVLATGVCAPDAVAPYLAAWDRLRAACPATPPEARVSTHNDLNPTNVLYDGTRLWLVDWEAAFASDPMVDPASIAFWWGVEGEREAAFLRAAFGQVDEPLRARFFLMRLVCCLFNGVMMLRLAAMGGAQGVADFTAPPLAQVRAGLGGGAVNLASTEGRLLFAKAALNAMRDGVESAAFERHLPPPSRGRELTLRPPRPACPDRTPGLR